MLKTIGLEIKKIVFALKKDGKIHLASEINKNWKKTLLEYSKAINAYKTDRPMENILKKAFTQELARLEYPQKNISEIIKYWEKHRILQTYPHITSAGKPRHFFIDYLASLALGQKDFYAVAMFSGVPFSNKTRPGRLCRKTGDINLIPSSMQDELVYRNKIPAKMLEIIENLPKEIKKLLPKAKIEEAYTAWALKSSKNIEKKFLHGKPVFFDFNEVTSNYLLFAIRDKDHPINKMFFSQKERILTIKKFKEVVFFYGPVQKGKYEEMENFYLRNGYLESASRKIKLTPEILEKELKNRLCPGMITGFLIFAFLNHFQCFGSFAQIEYLPFYHDEFSKFPFFKKYDIGKAPTGALTTGGFPNMVDLCPLDFYLGEKFIPNPDILFGESLLTIKEVLLHQNYSMNLVRK